MTNGIVAIIIIITNIIFSYRGFTNQAFFNGYLFEVDKILFSKDYKRLITSGFLHIDWTHLIFNMFSLFAFSGSLESELGAVRYLAIYFGSLIGGNLFSLFIHRNHGDYSAVGASGAVCGVIFASLALFPGMGVDLFGFFSLPGWLYGLLFVGYSIYGIRSKKDNIGHEAHLGGALIGMIIALLLQPAALVQNFTTIAIILFPTIFFIFIIITRPQALLVDNLFFKNQTDFYSIDHLYNAKKQVEQKEIDSILDKINKHGMASLTKKEKSRLEEYSRSMQ